MAYNTQKQAQDLLLILDKEKMLLRALAKADPNGKTKTVPPTPEHNNDFLRFNGSDLPIKKDKNQRAERPDAVQPHQTERKTDGRPAY